MKRVDVDMDGVLCDWDSGVAKIPQKVKDIFGKRTYKIPGLFVKMDPMPGAIEAFQRLRDKYDVYILSTAPWDNANAWKEKRLWVQQHLGKLAYKRLILTSHKNLLMGDYLIDDRTKNGAGKFEGQHIHFGTEAFPDWNTVLEYLEA